MPYNLTLKDRCLVLLGVILLKSIYFTCKKTFQFSPAAEQLLLERQNVVTIFWHGKQLMLPFLYQYACQKFGFFKFVMLISAHRDGRLISKAVEFFGISSVAGSSSKQARSASRKIIEELEQGAMIGITPDGPKGPIYKAKIGAYKIAEMLPTQIIPVSVVASKCWEFKSWDRMMLPKPFSKITFYVGAPIEAQGDTSHATTVMELGLNQAAPQA